MHAASALLASTFFDAQFVRWCVWVGLVVLTVALLLLIRTRWGQSQPLGKCIVLSLLAHLLLGIYSMTVDIVTATVGSPQGRGIQVSLADSADGDAPRDDLTVPDSWTELGAPASDTLSDSLDSPGALNLTDSPRPAANIQRQPLEAPLPMVPVSLPELSAPSDEPPPASELPRSPIEMPTPKAAEPIDAAPAEPDPVPPPPTDDAEADGTRPTNAIPNGGKSAADTDAAPANQAPLGNGAGGTGKSAGSAPLPEVMQKRAGDHLQGGRAFGATPESEAAVNDALRWLAANQRPNGRWDARGAGGGGQRAADGQDRQSAGLQADTGLTGLALLAFLAGGHTHLQGPHQVTVRRGLEYLLSMQDSEGCLGGPGNRYERMYCHAMATCALSEAYAMTRDRRLQSGVQRAIGYTLRAQDRGTGGWRYLPSDPGDTSQLGWQLMALKSAELAGMKTPAETRDGMVRFLGSVTLGTNGGLACYQSTRPIATRSMTAESMVCRQFLGMSISPQAAAEASAFLLQEPPGVGQTNHYYWYYATLAMYQLQGDGWKRWNAALQKSLLGSQRQDGSNSGSWDPDPVWGGCGGRVYSTALSTLCLEVYYRYLPLYVAGDGRGKSVK